MCPHIFIDMIKLIDLLLEDIDFKAGFDVDRPFGTKAVFVFHPNDDYIKQGKTHGVTSHAIKHIYEFDPELFSKVIDIVNKIIHKSPNKILLGLKNPESKKRFSYPYPVGTVVNTLDMINDKIVLGEELRKEEKEILPYLDTLKRKYSSILESTVTNAVNVDSAKSIEEIVTLTQKTGVIKFTVDARGEDTYAVTDLKTGILVLEKLNGEVLTGFRPANHKKSWPANKRLAKYLASTSVTVTNPLVNKFFGLD